MKYSNKLGRAKKMDPVNTKPMDSVMPKGKPTMQSTYSQDSVLKKIKSFIGMGLGRGKGY